MRVNNLVRRFGTFTAVDHISFEISRGEIFGLLGPNSAGKTTTFRMLCGLLPATSGTLQVAGADLRRARASARQRINTRWRAAHNQAGPPVQVVTRAWYDPNLETRWHMVPSLIGTLTMVQTLLLTAMAVAREREQGTFDQLLVTPMRPIEIMAGKALPSVLIGALQATNILLVAQLWFRIPFSGSFVTLYAGLSLFLLAAVGIGLLVSSVVATMQQAMLFTFLLVMPFTLLSGLATPISSIPTILQYVTLVNPLRYAIDIAQRVYLEGAGLDRLFPDLWPLAIIGIVTLSSASWMFRHRVT